MAKIGTVFWRTFLFCAIGLFGIVAVWAALMWMGWEPLPLKTKDAAGTFGDSFGAINAFFSGVVLAGVIATLWAQRKELEMQREGLELTREELRSTREEHRKAAEAQAQQVEIMRLNGLAAGRATVAQVMAVMSSTDPNAITTELDQAGMGEARNAGQALVNLLKMLRAMEEKAGWREREPWVGASLVQAGPESPK